MNSHNKIKASEKITNKKTVTIVVSMLMVLITIVTFLFINSIRHEALQNIKFSKPYEPPFTKNGQLIFLNKDKKNIKKTIDIEVAEDEDRRAQGLMWRRSMPDSVGMLFVFENERPLSFWMKNTYIPLDIIYVNKSMEIVTIQENTRPLNEMPIPSDKPAQYVVEVNAGFCGTNGIVIGDKIEFEKNKFIPTQQ